MPDFEVRLYDPTSSTLVHTFDPEVDGIADIQWQKAHNGVGAGSFTLPMDAPVTPAKGQVVRCYLDGRPHFQFRLRRPRVVSVSDDDGAGRVRLYSGPGLLADFDEGIIHPSRPWESLPAHDDRIWNYGSPDYPQTEMVAATEVDVVGPFSTIAPGYPTGFTDPYAKFIWDATGTTSGADWGYLFFHDDIDLADAVDDVVLQVAARNGCEVFFDEHSQGMTQDWVEPRRINFGTLSAGSHRLAITAFLVEAQDGDPAGLTYTLRGPGIDGPVIARSDSTTKVLARPVIWPGFAPGRIVSLAVADNPVLDDWTINGGGDSDADDVTYPVLRGWNAGNGSKVTALILGLCEIYTDLDVAPEGLELSLRVKGTPPAGGLTLVTAYSTPGGADPSAVNVAALDWEPVEGERFTAVAVRWKDGHITRPDPLPDVPVWRYVRAAGAWWSEEAAAVGDQLLAAYAAEDQVATIELLGLTGTDLPGGTWDAGYTLPVPVSDDHDETSDQLVRAVTVRVDDEGVVTVVAELGSLVEDNRKRLERQIEALEPGALGGYVTLHPRPVSPDPQPLPGNPTVPAGQTRLTMFAQPGNASWLSGPFHFPCKGVINHLYFEFDPAAIDTVIELLLNGDVNTTVTITAGSTRIVASPGITVWPEWEWRYRRVTNGGVTNVVVSADFTTFQS